MKWFEYNDNTLSRYIVSDDCFIDPEMLSLFFNEFEPRNTRLFIDKRISANAKKHYRDLESHIDDLRLNELLFAITGCLDSSL